MISSRVFSDTGISNATHGHANARARQLGNTALMRAAFFGHFDCVRILLEGGADKEAVDRVRLSPTHPSNPTMNSRNLSETEI
jgi:ankyrin repeat protein